MTTENIKELSKKLATLYGVDAFSRELSINGLWLAEDSGRISDLADVNELSTAFYHGVFNGVKVGKNMEYFSENYVNHSSNSAAARMARARCLIAIGEAK